MKYYCDICGDFEGCFDDVREHIVDKHSIFAPKKYIHRYPFEVNAEEVEE